MESDCNADKQAFFLYQVDMALEGKTAPSQMRTKFYKALFLS